MLKSIRNRFVLLRENEKGATLVEYGIALILAVSVAGLALTSLAQSTEANYTEAETNVTYR